MRMRFLFSLAILVLTALPAWSHVGSPNVFFEGEAGPYTVRVTIRPPGVVPGLAEIAVRVSADDVETVSVQPVRWDAGKEGAPPPDIATPVSGARQLYSAELWLMTGGSYSVSVDVKGERGPGSVIVPVLSVATRRYTMSLGMGALLAGLGGLLFVGGLSIMGAAVRESVLPPGEAPSPQSRQRGRRVMVGSAVVLSLAVFGGKVWWDNVDAEYLTRMYAAPHVTPTTRIDQGQRILRLTIDDLAWQQGRWPALIPDHGKLMHMFLIRQPQLDSFAHVHPISIDTDTFDVAIPPLPEGQYQIYADVTHESGFAQTLSNSVDIPAAPSSVISYEVLTPDLDDSWAMSDPIQKTTDRKQPLIFAFNNGFSMSWEYDGQPLIVGQDVSLRFVVKKSDGTPAALEPYMGMFGHAAIRRDDGAVFVHLHPTGTISMAAQQFFLSREKGATAADPHASMLHAMKRDGGTVSFPYAFSQPGNYRIWVQIKTAGQVLTGVFDTSVLAEETEPLNQTTRHWDIPR